ncbi:phosphoserine phosphatase [Rhizobium vallis]|uniref:Phosphoserine phosphatase n=2 Tax=Rhizobium vallis TaxID=634290 RepID=A0A432PQ08_9HYPH|nr:phosphoserine phosphatase [Rhizobium vallis]
MQIAFCDFDGTISKEDVTDLVLEKFALQQWHDIEEKWASGGINSAQCMRLQIPLIRASIDELHRFLDSVEIDAGFVRFRDFCRANDVRLVVVSDGVDHFIRRILSNHGVTDIEVIANHLVWNDDGDGAEFRLQTPFSKSGCLTASGVCKCAVIADCDQHIYIGDGRSDFCVSHQASAVFAKKKLAEYCDLNRIPYSPYQGFAEVQASLASILPGRAGGPLPSHSQITRKKRIHALKLE